MRKHAVWLVVCLAAAAGCKERPSRKSSGAAVPLPPPIETSKPTITPFPAAGVPAEVVSHSAAIYFYGKPKVDPATLFDGACAKAIAGFERVEEPQKAPGKAQLYLGRPPVAELPPPDEHMLEVNGVEVSEAQAAALQKSENPLLVRVDAPRAAGRAAVRDLDAFLQCVVERTDGIVVDIDTVQMFGAAAWRRRRVDAWDGDVPRLDEHVVVHVYQDGEYSRAVSLGLSKFGLPDLVIEDFLASDGARMVSIIDLVAQALVVDQRLPADGVVEIVLDRPELKGVIDRVQIVTMPGATRRLRLVATVATPEEGDIDNRQIRLRFDGLPGGGERERQAEAFRTLFGAADEKVSGVAPDDAEMNAARARAVKQLPALREQFARGLAPGAHMLVKAPFATPDGDSEWMWVEIVRWEGERIEGILQNDPIKATGVKLGAEVRVDQADVFDYLYVHADGTQEGNETGAILQRQQQQRQP